ncbi:MAG: dipicolinate synthase subunit DpsA [Clostridia bacterium]|nr:dipicolinate synthase subunit DpsA [Clostridia bacterium]
MGLKDFNYLIAGGDDRQLELYKFMLDMGYRVNIVGFDDFKQNNIFEYLKESEIIIFPVPSITNKVFLNSRYSNKTYIFNELLEYINKDSKVFGSKFNETARLFFLTNNIEFYDLTENQEFSILNSIPTAEGVIQIAMEKSNITIHNSRVLILGFGKSGKCITHLFKSMGADVTVEARKSSDLAWIEQYACKGIHLNQLKYALKDKDFIINTIPTMILDEEMLNLVNKETIIIDIASKPGGVDFMAAKRLGITADIYPGLPGKIAPKSSAKIIYKIFSRILSAKIK